MDIQRIRELMKSGESIYNIQLRVTFYARVSTEKEEQHSSLENQVEYYTAFIKEKPAWEFVPGYIDEGLSGGSVKKRDSFNRMIEDARQGKFDIIVTKEISRFSRNTLESILYTRELLDMGVCVMFQNDGIFTLDSDSEFRLVIMAGVAQDEIRKLSERLKFGFRQSIKNGRVLGNSRMYGYYKKDCRMEINEEQAIVVRTIFDLYANRMMGFRKIAQHVYDNLGATSYNGNQFNVKTVQNIIKNPKYKGFYCANKTRSLDYRTHKNENLDMSEWVIYRDENIPAIVSEEIWDRANEIMEGRSSKVASYEAVYKNRYAYSGKILCAEHHTAFYRTVQKTVRGDNELWICKIHKNRGIAACSAPKLHTKELNLIMSQIFTSMHFDKNSLIERTLSLIESSSGNKNYDFEIKKANNELEAIVKKKDKLLDMSIDGIITKVEFKERNDRLNAESACLVTRINNLEPERQKSDPAPEILEKIRMTLTQELSFENNINSELVATILDKVTVHSADSGAVRIDILLHSGETITRELTRQDAFPCCNSSS